MGILEEILFALQRLADAAERIADVVDQPNDPPPTPGMGSIEFTGEEQQLIGGVNVDFIKFKVSVPEEATPDVVRRDIQVTLADGTNLDGSVPGREAGLSGEFKGEQDSVIAVSIWNVDDAGNRSAVPSSFSATLLDTFAPPTPGEAGLVISGEETV